MHSRFSPDSDSGINPLDQVLSIDWPIKDYIISPKDLNLPMMKKLL